MIARTQVLVVAAVLGLSACSSGGTGGGGSSEQGTALGATWHRTWSPYFRLDNHTHIGAGVLEGLDLSSREIASGFLGRHGAAAVFHGRVTDGVGRERLAAYLKEDVAAGEYKRSNHVERFGDTPPVVRVVYGTSDRHWWDVQLAVQMINASLPNDWQLALSNDRAPKPTRNANQPREGEIVVAFARRETWPDRPADDRTGQALTWAYDTGEITRGEVWVDHTRTDGRSERLHVIVHELLHVLGRGHPDPYRFRDTVMKTPGHENSGFILYPLDREALLAVYSRLDPGTRPEDILRRLGAWKETSIHVAGALEFRGGIALFGAAERNGLVQPWASGPTPDTWIEDNPALRGRATWRGRLLGLTPRSEAVAGAAEMSVGLASLDGDLDFTGLESWRANARPGAVGTGTRWRDGDLSYGIEVSGNGFYATSGDEGVVNGAFFGVAHEGMGGTLKRDDLSAGFGGVTAGPAGTAALAVAEPAAATLTTVGTVAETGTETYDEFSFEFPLGRLEGTRATWSYAGWGLWGEGAVFSATIRGTMFPGPVTSRSLIDPFHISVTGLRSFDNPAGYGTATWTGGVRAYETHPRSFGTPVEGDARLTMDLDSLLDTVDVDFTGFDRGHEDMSWNSVYVSLGGFRRLDLEGQFYGDRHEGVAGTFERDGLKGVFGAMRD